MRCSSKSTRSFVSGSLFLLLWTAPLHGGRAIAPEVPTASEADAGDAVVGAIRRAVQVRVGREANISVSAVSGVRLVRESALLVAVPDPSARVGVPVRFVITDGTPGRNRVRLGEATATVQISTGAVRARRAIARGNRLEADAVATINTDLTGRPFRPVLTIEETVGARAVRDIAEDAVVTHADITPEPLVKAGDLVKAYVHVDGVEMAGAVVAAENGSKDDVIRVVNQGSRHAFRARVIASGEVEVVNVR